MVVVITVDMLLVTVDIVQYCTVNIYLARDKLKNTVSYTNAVLIEL